MPSQPKNTRRRSGLTRWWILALAIHAEVLLAIGVSIYFYGPRDADLERMRALADGADRIELTSLDDDTSRRLLADLEREQEKARQEEIKKEVESPDTPGQVVEMARPREELRPDEAKFAAEYDSSTDKETKKLGKLDPKAQQSRSPGEAAANSPLVPPTPPPSPAAPNKAGALALRTPGRTQQSGSQALQTPPPAAKAPAPDGEPREPLPFAADGVLPLTGKLQLRPPFGEPGSQGSPLFPSPGAPAMPALAPSQQQVARALGSGTEDYLKDVDEGDDTSLNAKKWKYASFFNRVKQQVRDHWKPADAYRRRDPTGAIYGSKDRYTLLRVQLKPDGSLANVFLQQPSGVEFLDDEAIEAFKQAQPFANPPPQLVEGRSGMIQFSFGFFFELSGAPKLRVFRYNNM